MNTKLIAIEPLIKRAGKSLAVPQEIKPLKKKMKRAKPLKYGTGEKVWDKQINDILSGKGKTKDKEETMLGKDSK